jgi:predicted component of type VI protein secretion system
MANKKTDGKATTKPATEKTETKAQKFVRLAQARVPKALKSIYNIGNLGGAGYDSTPDQREKIATALREAVESCITRINKEQVKPTGFSL